MKYSLTKKQKKTLYEIITAIVLTVAVFFVLRAVESGAILAGSPEWVEPAMKWLYLIPYFVVGRGICMKAFRSLYKHGQFFDENLLMTVATAGAFGLGEMLEGVAVMLFYQIGELFQSIAVGKSRQSISELMDIMPDYANLLDGTQVEKVDPDEVEVGSKIVVYPGERIPLDGIILEGSSSINTSALTGESVPRDVAPGDEVLSGCINMNGAITVKTTKQFEESTATKILELVENSAMNKAKSEDFITRFARVYTPVVCFAALALAVIPPVVILLTGGKVAAGAIGTAVATTSAEAVWSTWGFRALTFLVISCPCALVISIPLSFFAGIGAASSNGVLVKGSNYLEALSKVKYVVMDKTGTLTKGEFEVQEISTEEGFTEEEVLEMAAHAELGSSHPISLSLKRAYEETHQIDAARVTNIQELPGKGVKAVFDGKEIAVGNFILAKIEADNVRKYRRSANVYVVCEGKLAGRIFVADGIKDSAKAAVEGMRKSGIKRIFMLTGDSKAVAENVKNQLGLDGALAEKLPQEKVEHMEDFIEAAPAKELVAFVGDGINDAPVLARADVGIAMGALGSDAAIEAADVVLMDDDPQKISLAIKISRKTLKIVKENIVFSLAIKAACLLLAALGIANMWMAIFADVGVMIIATMNATRALHIKQI